jgi:hypothetical protein
MLTLFLQLSMLSKWSENATMPLLHPRCETVASKTMPLTPASMQGWELVNRNDKKSYETTEPGSIIVRRSLDMHELVFTAADKVPTLCTYPIRHVQTFNVKVIEGQLGLFIWKTGEVQEFGELICWVDDNQREDSKKVAKSFTTRSAASFEHTGDMFKTLSPGDHVLTCRSKASPAGGTTVRISAVVAR